MTDNLLAALEYARRGWRVTYTRDWDAVDADGKALAKAPASPAWPKTASTDPNLVVSWFSGYPDRNVGIVCGERSNVFVLDVDLDGNGPDTLAGMEREHGALPDTRIVSTASGGMHVFFAWPGWNPRNSVKKLGPGLDIRAESGFIVAPPSRTEKGFYTVAADVEQLPQAPAWLLELLREEKVQEQPELPANAASASPAVAPHNGYAAAALAREVADVKAEQIGGRNDRLNKAAFSIGTLAATGALDIGDAARALVEAGVESGLSENEAYAAVRSGLNAGLRQPRGVRK